MIIRILGEGQWEVGEDQVDGLNELDSAVETAVGAGDETGFRTALTALVDRVREVGERVADDALVDSDLALPPADATLAEVRAMLEDDGLIPG